MANLSGKGYFQPCIDWLLTQKKRGHAVPAPRNWIYRRDENKCLPTSLFGCIVLPTVGKDQEARRHNPMPKTICPEFLEIAKGSTEKIFISRTLGMDGETCVSGQGAKTHRTSKIFSGWFFPETQ